MPNLATPSAWLVLVFLATLRKWTAVVSPITGLTCKKFDIEVFFIRRHDQTASQFGNVCEAGSDDVSAKCFFHSKVVDMTSTKQDEVFVSHFKL